MTVGLCCQQTVRGRMYAVFIEEYLIQHGNTVIWKAPTHCPLSAHHLLQLVASRNWWLLMTTIVRHNSTAGEIVIRYLSFGRIELPCGQTFCVENLQENLESFWFFKGSLTLNGWNIREWKTSRLWNFNEHLKWALLNSVMNIQFP